MMMKTLAFAAAFAVSGVAAQAVTMDAESYSASGHSMYLFSQVGGLGKDYHFSPAGEFTTDGSTGTLTGTLVAENDNTNGFVLEDVIFDQNFAVPPEYKQENGAAPTPADNYFLNLAGGTLRGFGGILDGLILKLERRPIDGPQATQIGTGSNAKNATDYGLASWIFVSASDASTCSFCTNQFVQDYQRQRGDFNLKLNGGTPPGPVVPLPAGGILLMSAIAGAGAMRARKKV